MAQHSLLSPGRVVHWPSEYSAIVNILKGLDAKGQASHDGLYGFNTGVLVLAASIGLVHKRERPVGPDRQDIRAETFEAHRFGGSPLSAYVLVIPLIGTQDVELLRPEREDELIQKFERYAAGGLQYLHEALSTSSDSTGHAIVRAEVARALRVFEAMSADSSLKI